jgi:hypothetical protein
LFEQDLALQKAKFAVKKKRFTVLDRNDSEASRSGSSARRGDRAGSVSLEIFYRSKWQYVALEVDHDRQLNRVQEENAWLKRLVSDLLLYKAMPQDVLSNNFFGPHGASRLYS